MNRLSCIVLCLSACLGLPDGVKLAAAEPGSIPDEEHLFKPNWGPVVDGFRVSLAFEKDTYSLGEPIKAKIQLVNVSNQERHLPQSEHSENDFQIIIIDNRRQRVSFNSSFEGNMFRSKMPLLIKSGEEFAYPLRLDTMFSLNAPGQYVAYVKRLIPSADNMILGVLGKVGTNDILLPVAGRSHTEIASENVIFNITGKGDAAAQPSSNAGLPSPAPGIFNPTENKLPVRGNAQKGSSASKSAVPPLQQNQQGKTRPILHSKQQEMAATDEKSSPAVMASQASSRNMIYGSIVLFLLGGTAWWLGRGWRAGPSSRNK